jgi:hypothetical protein
VPHEFIGIGAVIGAGSTGAATAGSFFGARGLAARETTGL